MHGNLASIRETVDLAATEVLDAALTFLAATGIALPSARTLPSP